MQIAHPQVAHIQELAVAVLHLTWRDAGGHRRDIADDATRFAAGAYFLLWCDLAGLDDDETDRFREIIIRRAEDAEDKRRQYRATPLVDA